jgi:hypothetical protein
LFLATTAPRYSLRRTAARPNKSLHASRTGELLIESLRVSQLRAAA